MDDDDNSNPFDFGFFSGDFNDFVKNIQKMIEDLLQKGNLTEDIEKFLEDLGNNSPFVAGFSFKRGLDGKPYIEQFGDLMKQFGLGNVASKFNEKKAAKDRAPIVDIIEEDETIRVIIEMPGVEKRDIDLHSRETVLKIKANSTNRRYKKDIVLPCPVIPTSSKAVFKNGVLEITLKRK